MMCLGTFGMVHFYSSANDAYVDVTEDIILFSQMAFGIIFLVYVIANFLPAMVKGLSVSKILFKPLNMPYFTARLASIIGTLGFVILTHLMAYYESYAGYFIGVADYFELQENHLLSKQYYELSNIYGRQNNRANMSLAKLSAKEDNRLDMQNFLALSINRNPTEFAYADLGESFIANNRYFDALFTLENGVDEFPYSGYLANNLGVHLSKSEIIDSAYFYLATANKGGSKNNARVNLLALYALKEIKIPEDSITYLLSEEYNNATKSNLIRTTGYW